MALSVVQSSSLTLTASEQTVGSAVTSGDVVVLELDLVNMAAGDIVELHCYTKTTSGGTARALWSVGWANQQGHPHYQTPPIPAPYSVEFKLVQPTGTGRSVDYALFTL